MGSSTYDELSAAIKELRSQAGDGGLADDDIDICLLQLVNNNNNNNNKNKQDKQCGEKKRCRMFALCWCVFTYSVVSMVGLGLFYGVVSSFKPLDRKVGKLLEPLGGPLLKAVRKLTLPVTQFMDLTALQESGCVVSNPWFEEPQPACDACHDIQVVTFTHPDPDNLTFHADYYMLGIPVVVKRGPQKEVRWGDVQEVLTDRQQLPLLRTRPNDLKCEGINTECVLSAIVYNHTEADLLKLKTLHISWHSRSPEAARQLRLVFPRPEFAPVDSQVALDKGLSIDGPQAQAYYIDRLHTFSSTWYVQGTGRRKLTLVPKSACAKTCRALPVDVAVGDLLYFNSDYWMLKTEPVQSTSLSVAFWGTFS